MEGHTGGEERVPVTSQCFLCVRTADWIQLSYQAPGLPAPCQNIQPSCLATGPVPCPQPPTVLLPRRELFLPRQIKAPQAREVRKVSF